MRLTIRRKLFLSHFLAVLLVSGSIGSYFYLSAVSSLTESIQLRLESTAALVGQILDARELTSIRTAADRDRPEYPQSPDPAAKFGADQCGHRVFVCHAPRRRPCVFRPG